MNARSRVAKVRNFAHVLRHQGASHQALFGILHPENDDRP
jgi:hypothetical protein